MIGGGFHQPVTKYQSCRIIIVYNIILSIPFVPLPIIISFPHGVRFFGTEFAILKKLQYLEF